MQVFDSVAAWRDERRALRSADLSLGFVPTMGALHDGHASLVRRSRAENDRTLVSIFVNPTQFDDPHDLSVYPRTIEPDLELLQREDASFVVVPSEADLYADGFRYRVSENQMSRVLEGAARPGHFDGVLTVVLKLLHLAAADRAYFGEKDWQQLALIRGMVKAFLLPTSVVACPTVRDRDGLAMSSRNGRLSPTARRQAPEFHRALVASPTAGAARRRLTAAGFSVDYVEDWDGRRLGAVRLDDVRLVDNVPIRRQP